MRTARQSGSRLNISFLFIASLVPGITNPCRQRCE